MNFSKFLPVIMFVLFAATACKKSVSVKPNSPTDTTTTIQNGPNVYAAGGYLAANGYTVACYWKNGVITKLADSSYNTMAISIKISGNDVYVTGLTKVPGYGNLAATYWKNGIATQLPNFALPSLSEATMNISGSDVYVSGYLSNKKGGNAAGYWKNGIETVFTEDSIDAEATSIWVNGSDVYVAGYTTPPDSPAIAAYWKNGQITKLTHDTVAAVATAITTIGNDVYVAGYTQKVIPFYGYGNQIATLWKNGVRTALTSGNTLNVQANAMAVSGGDLYVAGYVYRPGGSSMMYWKNGVPTTIDVSSLTNNAMAITASITVNGTDVYLTSGFTGYLKNGSFVPLPKAYIVYGIDVISK